MEDFLICALTYGDYPLLASRCLGSLKGLSGSGASLRVGANSPSEASLEAVLGAVSCWAMDWSMTVRDPQIHKYPMMRLLLGRDGVYPAPDAARYVVWFDDDSYLSPEAAADAPRWLGLLRLFMEAESADVAGEVWTKRFEGRQAEWVAAQDWYGGKAFRPDHTVRFATGGWWCARREVLDRHDWPQKSIRHNGGDVMLGELCRQQGYRLKSFNRGVLINADECGRRSRSARRGLSERPVGHRGPGS